MRIGELARRTNVSTRALRYYEERGLLAPERSGSGQRHYQDAAVERVRLIRQLLAAGLGSTTIAELTSAVVDGQATPELLDRLAEERRRLGRQITDLLHARDVLDVVIEGASTNLSAGRPCGTDVT